MSETTVAVPLSGGRDYQIHIGAGLLASAGGHIAAVTESRRAVIITQPAISKQYAAPLIESLRQAGFDETPVLTFPAGEKYKTLATVTQLCDGLYNLVSPVDRKTVIIALGGGVVGDVAGFVAAIYLRGLDYVQIPTTLLAMVDSSVGGKTGVDFREGKNLVGAFHQPRVVLIDTDTLNSLPARERRAGMGEVVKYGLIRDPELLSFVTGHGERLTQKPDAVAHIIRRSCEIKADVVGADEYETTGLRAILNYGHTIGHALEAATGYKRFKHGEAVAIGMIAAAYIGEEQGVTPPMVRAATLAALRAQGLPTDMPADVDPIALMKLLGRDKKAEAGRARFVLARKVGEVELRSDVTGAAIRDGLRRATEAAANT
jgi:3-dehydroquinate synthase